jgi:hypothetical protein
VFADLFLRGKPLACDTKIEKVAPPEGVSRAYGGICALMTIECLFFGLGA